MSLATNVSNLATRIATEFKSIRTLISGSGTGGISALTTTDKTSLVAAINEVKTQAGNAGWTAVPASETVSGILKLASVADSTTGTDTLKAVTPAGLKAATDAVKTNILGSAPAALDTLNELAAALGNDANYAATVTAALANKQPLDADLTAIAALTSAADKIPYSTAAQTWALASFTAAGRTLVGAADAAAQRTSLSVYSQAEVGDVATDFVSTFNAGLL